MDKEAKKECCPILIAMGQTLLDEAGGYELGSYELREGNCYRFGPGEVDEVDEATDLIALIASKSATHAYTCLRGFMLIEYMVEYVGRIANKPNEIRLKERSWKGLTELMLELRGVGDDASLTYTEAELNGVQVLPSGATVSEKGLPAEYVKKANKAHVVRELCACTYRAAKLLRPYLKNDKASVTGVVSSYVWLEGKRCGFYETFKPMKGMMVNLLNTQL